MNQDPLEAALARLTDIQRKAVFWVNGPLLVLAGPGSGKTQVLTCRVANLLRSGEQDSFRILALTFTNKAADEMQERVSKLVPGMEERALITTFHSFCGQVLRQHGVHIGISPNFTIYSRDEDRRSILMDALRKFQLPSGRSADNELNLLGLVDRLKSRLIAPERAAEALKNLPNSERLAEIYRAYQDELAANNALDFNSLIFEAHKLFTLYPNIAVRYSRSHPHWLVDEFQDTTDAQYRLLRAMSGEKFSSLFVVADDDQIIYQWNGASFRQIQRLLADYKAAQIQLPTNYRCPPAIVEAANRLVAYNRQRSESKAPLLVGKTEFRFSPSEQIQMRVFEDSEDEAKGIAEEISGIDKSARGEVAVLARTRKLLEELHRALDESGVEATIAQRRDDFLSAELRFVVACLRQLCRPLDRLNLAVLVESFNRVSGTALSAAQVVADSEVTGNSYLSTWIGSVEPGQFNEISSALYLFANKTLKDAARARGIADEAIAAITPKGAEEHDVDLREDIAAWKQLVRDIGRQLGANASLEHFLQELQLRSKEPVPGKGSVTLMTVHAAKGREFDTVYVVGLAEDVLPSYQSRQKGEASPEMEEERRNCFVAITRAKERLILSRAKRYRGWAKAPSRFLVEMGLAQ